jgi:hypothetical protein
MLKVHNFHKKESTLGINLANAEARKQLTDTVSPEWLGVMTTDE